MIEDKLVAKDVKWNQKIQELDHVDYFNVNPFDVLDGYCTLKITLFKDEDIELGTITYKLVRDNQIMEGEFQDSLKTDSKKTNLSLRYQIYLKSIDETQYKDN